MMDGMDEMDILDNGRHGRTQTGGGGRCRLRM